MTRPQNLLLTVCFLLSSAALAQPIPSDVRRAAAELRDSALAGSAAWDIVESLVNEVGPRPAGSAGDVAAVAWSVAKLEALGFSNVRAEDVVVPHWDRGTLDVRMTGPYAQPIVAASLGGSPGTPGEGIEAEVVRVPSLAALRELSERELGGRIAFVDHVMERHRSGRGYGTSSRIRGCAHYAAAERGALATLIRSAGTSEHRFAHTGSMIRNGQVPTIPGIAIANADADMLAYAAGSESPVTIRIHSTARQLPDHVSANVIGEVPGKGELADEIVLLGAHLDSWDLGVGAIDDGAGVAIVTAAAKLIIDSGVAPRRTIRVVLYANEEFGLSGARQYYENYGADLDKHVLGMEADFGAGRVWQLASRVADDSLVTVLALHNLLEPIGIELGGNQSGGGADLTPLRRAGMPVLGLRQDGTDYFDYHHTADDTLDKIDRGDLDQNVAAFVTAAWVAANIDSGFGRLPVDTSERSCAAEYD